VAALARRSAEAGNHNAASDAAVAAALALAACKGGTHNVEINIAGLSQPESGRELLNDSLEYLRRTEELSREAEVVARRRIRPER
jgi:formiminotetrahydrofolate cyclodeaminase